MCTIIRFTAKDHLIRESHCGFLVDLFWNIADLRRYHSDPYMVEMNAVPGYANVTATFVDNYSQVCIDLGATNSGNVGIGVRFGGLDTYILSADQAAELIWYAPNRLDDENFC